MVAGTNQTASPADQSLRGGRRPRVLHLGFEDPRRPGAGGGSVRTHAINRRLADAYDLTVVCARYKGARPRVEDGVRYVHIGLPWGYFPSILAYFACIPYALLRYRSELVVEDFGAPFSTIGVPWLTRRPVVGVVQWLFAREKSREYHLPFHLVEATGLRAHRDLIAVSGELGQNLAERNRRARVQVVRNGLDDEAFAEREPKPRQDIAYLGRLEIAQKGLDLLLDAFAQRATEFDGSLLIGGDGPDGDTLMRTAQDLGIADRVTFCGRVPANERFDFLAGAALVAMPSRYETFGMVAAEALAVGTPVVAFDIACLRDLVTADTGVVVPPEDPAALAKAISDLMNDPERRERLGRAGPPAVARLRWDELADEQAAIYRRVLDDRSAIGRPARLALNRLGLDRLGLNRLGLNEIRRRFTRRR